ncbi:MAG: hypothetical protein QMB78_09370, partial [Rhodospirillales bacterium]
QVVNEVEGFPGPPQTITIDEASKIWGAGAANYTMGSTARSNPNGPAQSWVGHQKAHHFLTIYVAKY